MYEIFMRSFADSDGDGIGDLKGITSRLDYLDSLGVEGLWLTPFNKATSYHKYDVEDYYAVDPEYGTMADLQMLVQEAHRRDIKVLMDLVINHCSSSHPWFKDACSGPDSPYRDWFVWAQRDIIVSEPEHWHFVPGSDTSAPDVEKYYGFFWSGMPDFNFDNPAVRAEMKKIGAYWLTVGGVDGYRLDAAQHIYPEGETSKNHVWWREFRKSMDEVKPGFFMVGEIANKNEVVAPYLQGGMHAAFNFDLATDILKEINAEEDHGLVYRLVGIRDLYYSYSSSYIDATFVSNHDQNRIMTVLGDDPAKAKLAAAILLTLPGSPYLYYGEEIGMRGQKPDELIREPFPWTYDANDPLTTRWESPVYTIAGQVNCLAAQCEVSTSVYASYLSWISLRRSEPCLYDGNVRPVDVSDAHLLAYRRSLKGQQDIIVLHNLSHVAVEATDARSWGIVETLAGPAYTVGSKDRFIVPPFSTCVFRLK